MHWGFRTTETNSQQFFLITYLSLVAFEIIHVTWFFLNTWLTYHQVLSLQSQKLAATIDLMDLETWP